MDDSRIRSKTAPFSFKNGLVWTGPSACHAFRGEVLRMSAWEANGLIVALRKFDVLRTSHRHGATIGYIVLRDKLYCFYISLLNFLPCAR